MASSDQATVKVGVQLDLDATLELLQYVRQGMLLAANQLMQVEAIMRQFRDQQPQPGHEHSGGAECGRHGGPCATGHRYDESCLLDPPGSDRALYIEDVREERPSEAAMRKTEPFDLTQFRTPPLTLADTDEQVEEI